jgi:divalent metal cation (Fe/Co/Zn/Cd) transporter
VTETHVSSTTLPSTGDACCEEESRPSWSAGARLARWLAGVSLAWMTVEGVVGLFAGYRSGSSSLIGWAFGSAIEAAASLIVIWRFTGRRVETEQAERLAQRAVAITFFLLAPYIAVLAALELARGQPPATTVVGIALTATGLVAMPGLGAAKRRLGARLGSGATAGEGTQNYLCAAQAGGVLVALVLTAMAPGAWVVDPAVALAIAVWSVREGIDAWWGEDCC